MIFSLKQTCHSQTGGRVPHLGKIPTFSRFFFLGSVPKHLFFEGKIITSGELLPELWGEIGTIFDQVLRLGFNWYI